MTTAQPHLGRMLRRQQHHLRVPFLQSRWEPEEPHLGPFWQAARCACQVNSRERARQGKGKSIPKKRERAGWCGELRGGGGAFQCRRGTLCYHSTSIVRAHYYCRQPMVGILAVHPTPITAHRAPKLCFKCPSYHHRSCARICHGYHLKLGHFLRCVCEAWAPRVFWAPFWANCRVSAEISWGTLWTQTRFSHRARALVPAGPRSLQNK